PDALLVLFNVIRPPPISTLFPYTTLFRSTLLPLPFASERFFGGVLQQDSGILTHTFLPETKTPPVVLAGEHVILHPVAEDTPTRSEEHTSELQSRENIVCRLLLEKKKKLH